MTVCINILYILVERGNNNKIRAFNFSPLSDYALGLCDVMDVKKISIKSQQPPCTGGLKLLHGTIGTYGKGKK